MNYCKISLNFGVSGDVSGGVTNGVSTDSSTNYYCCSQHNLSLFINGEAADAKQGQFAWPQQIWKSGKLNVI